jgi:hypothetical protein
MVMLFVVAVPSFATSINPLLPGWVQIDFTYTVTDPGFYGEWTDGQGRVHPAITKVGDVFSGYIRWDLSWWNPAREPYADCDEQWRTRFCWEIGFDVPDYEPWDDWITHRSDEDEVVLIEWGWTRDWMYFSGEDDESAQDSMNLYGNFKSRRLTGGVVRVEPWDDGVPGFYGAVNPSRVPEPSVLAVLIAGCLALAMGHRIYNR